MVCKIPIFAVCCSQASLWDYSKNDWKMQKYWIIDYWKGLLKSLFNIVKDEFLQKRNAFIKWRNLKLLRNCTSLQYYQVQFLTNSPYNCIVAVAQNKFDKLPSLTSNSCLISYQILKIVLYFIFLQLVTPCRVAMFLRNLQYYGIA